MRAALLLGTVLFVEGCCCCCPCGGGGGGGSNYGGGSDYRYEDNQGIMGSGVYNRDTREVGPFQHVEVNGIGKVVVTSSQPTNQVVVDWDDNLVQYVQTDVVGDTLTITLDEQTTSSRTMLVEVSTATLNEVDVNGAIELELIGLSGPMLDLDVDGAAMVTGDGAVDELILSTEGAAAIDLPNLVTQKTKVTVDGAGAATVHATDSIDAKVNGFGAITYRGNPPNVVKKVNGLGVIQAE
jgi:hypothetical protein